jgi:hypothetical protein
VRRIDNDWQMRFRLQDWNSTQIERIACRGFERANAALAEDYVWIPLVEDVLGAHHQIVNRGAESALKQHGKPAATHFFQEREVVHVAGPDLKTVRIPLDYGKIARIHDFGDNRQACFRARFSEETKPLFA